MSCNPCQTPVVNTAENETLSSQIENFTKSFFGSVVKTEVNGVVSWVLPCNLDVGLENNARGADEGLACYFLRLFGEGIVGLTGPQGATGAAGTNGNNAFTVTIASFTQPTLGAPDVTVTTAYNPAIIAGINVFIQNSGYYTVNNVDTSGHLYLTLTKAVTGATGTISAGKLVVPAGYPGASVTGPTGPTGATGPAGPAGESLTEQSDDFQVNSGTDWALQVVPTAVSFTTSSPQVTLPAAGVYLITAVVALEGETGVLANDEVTLKLYNTSIAADVPGSKQIISNLVDTQKTQVVLHALYQADAASQQIALYGDCTTADKVTVIATRTVITYVRVQ